MNSAQARAAHATALGRALPEPATALDLVFADADRLAAPLRASPRSPSPLGLASPGSWASSAAI